MHNPASPQAIESFSALLQSPQTVLYADTCIGAKDNGTIALGLNFIASMKGDIRRSGKKINIIHYVHSELLKKKEQKQRWAIDTLSFIQRNKDIFNILEKSDIEKELDDMPGLKNFADEALRRTALADVTRNLQPAFLTGDYACGLGISSGVPESTVYVIDRNANAGYSVLLVNEFVQHRTSNYIADKLPAIFADTDMILTSSALRSKDFPHLLSMLRLSGADNQKLPVYIHETSISKAKQLPAEFSTILDRVHIVKDGDFLDEHARLLASYLVRKQHRNVMLVGSQAMLNQLREKAALSSTNHCHGHHDSVQYCTIGLLGMLHALKGSSSGQGRIYIPASKIIQQAGNATAADGMGHIVAEIMQEARRGNASAMKALSLMYSKGCGVTKSKLMAQLWKRRSMTLRKEQTAKGMTNSPINTFKNKLAEFFTTIQDIKNYVLWQRKLITPA